MSGMALRSCSLRGPSARSLLSSCLPLFEVSTSPPSHRFLHTSLPCQELLQFRHRPDIMSIKHDVIKKQFQSGDKEGMPKPNLKRLRPGFELCKELDDAHPDVRRLCSMEFGTGNERRHLLELDLIGKVQRFASDFASIEARIARITAQIRVAQVHIKVPINAARDGAGMALLVEAVNRRKKYLRRLREWDYNKFCWVLEQLNLEYASPMNTGRATRREIAKALVLKEAMEIRRDKFIKYHQELKSKQEGFLVRKEKELAQINEEEALLQAELDTLKESDHPEGGGTTHLAEAYVKS